MTKWLGNGGMPIIDAIGAALTEFGDGWVAGTWTPTLMACNPAGTAQAGVHSVVLDAAMNFAINASLDGKDRTRGTLEMKAETMRPAPKDVAFTVRGEVVRMAKQVAYAEAWVRDADDQLVSRATATFLLHRAET